MLSFNLENNVEKIDTKWIEKKYQKEVDKIWNDVVNKTAAGSNMTGWLNLKEIYCLEEVQAMKAKANEWTKAGIKDIVVIGIGLLSITSDSVQLESGVVVADNTALLAT